MLAQAAMIERVRQLCQQDQRLVGALQYGSFARLEGDAYSDIEFALFFEDGALAALDQQAWVSQVAPVELYFADDFGHHTAIFGNLIRGEFHFNPCSAMHEIEKWQGYDWFPSVTATLLLDRTGELVQRLQPLIGPPPLRDTPEEVRRLTSNIINIVLFGITVLIRGEQARALDLLNSVQRYLLFLARLHEQSIDHWPTPSRNVEHEISPAAYARFRSCTAPLDQEALWTAYIAAWNWAKDLMQALSQRHSLALPSTLIMRIDAHIHQHRPTML